VLKIATPFHPGRVESMASKKSLNKSAKKVSKEISQQSKTAAKNVKSIGKAVSKTAKVFSKASKQRQKKSYTLRQLPIKYRGEKVTDFLLNLEQHPELDRLKKPGEHWEFSFFGNHSRKIYETLDLAAADLYTFSTSSQTAENRKGDHKTDQELLENIRLIKFGGKGIDTEHELSDEEYDELVNQHSTIIGKKIKRVRERKVKLRTEATDLVEKKTGKKIRLTDDLLEGLLDLQKSLQKQNDSLNRKLAKLEKELKKGSKKPAKKKAGKTNVGKGITKKTGSKKTSKVQKPTKANAKPKTSKPTGKAKKSSVAKKANTTKGSKKK
jgi:hypothetical protein